MSGAGGAAGDALAGDAPAGDAPADDPSQWHKWTAIVQHSLVSTVSMMTVPMGEACNTKAWCGQTVHTPPAPVMSTFEFMHTVSDLSKYQQVGSG